MTDRYLNSGKSDYHFLLFERANQLKLDFIAIFKFKSQVTFFDLKYLKVAEQIFSQLGPHLNKNTR